ncbi:MAG TPA: chlorite dismutase family protein [Candidatus Saccharimonadales bacterium]|nr:chlorite dismutase family protein [Candidatus Saccharimonadales bacterium]
MKYHSYIFFNVSSDLEKVIPSRQVTLKKAFLKELSKDKKVVTYTYATLGFKKNTSILIWFQSDSLESIQDLLNRLMHTKLGMYLKISYTLLGMTRPTKYSSASSSHLDTGRKGGAYLIIYPFTKTKEWHMLSFEKRKELMKGHIDIGRKFPQITQLLLYSYGVDDQEFIVSYETDDLPDFQSLVMELRSDKVREYTLSDTPIFTCIYKSPEEVLNYL